MTSGPDCAPTTDTPGDALLIANAVVASLGFLQLLMLVELTDPASIFLFTVRDL